MLAPIAPDFPPRRAQEIAVRNDTVAALCRALDTALRETVGGWDTGAAARALHAAGAFAATLPAADAELDARRGRVLRRLVRVQEDTPSRVAADLTRALADAPPGATFVDELFFAVASATNDALLTNDPAAIAPALAAAEAACAAFCYALRQRQLPAVHFLNEAGRLDACLTRDLRGRLGRLLSSAAPSWALLSRTSGRLMFCGRRSGRRRGTLSGDLSAGLARRRRALRSSCGLSTSASLRAGTRRRRVCGRRVCRAGGARP